jgi:hypothetical protein
LCAANDWPKRESQYSTFTAFFGYQFRYEPINKVGRNAANLIDWRRASLPAKTGRSLISCIRYCFANFSMGAYIGFVRGARQLPAIISRIFICHMSGHSRQNQGVVRLSDVSLSLYSKRTPMFS